MANKNPDMSGLKSFKKGEKRTTENAKKGGDTSEENRQQRNLFANTVKEVVLGEASPKDINKIALAYPKLSKEDVTNIMVMVCAMVREVIDEGNVQAFNTLRDTMGEKPVDKKELTGKDGAPLSLDRINVDSVKNLKDKINAE